jgi:hypothetical protein
MILSKNIDWMYEYPSDLSCFRTEAGLDAGLPCAEHKVYLRSLRVTSGIALGRLGWPGSVPLLLRP